MEYLPIGVAAAVVIVAVTALAPKVGVAAPLVLMLLGVGVSFLPWVVAIEIQPEWILAGVLPPLLYSSAVSLPTMDFRRDFSAIGGLSVLLVVISAALLGGVFTWLIPGIPLATGIALGAIVSPTDAVATSIVKRLGAPPRVVTVLEGEGLLNDASALVLLRSAIAATAVSVSLWDVARDFMWAVALAVVCGLIVGRVGLMVRARLRNAALSTAVSFVVPFLAYLPAEELNASGLVAVVTAGLVTGSGAAKHLTPQDRISETSNWRTVETLLEGAVFLAMGLELFGLVEDVLDVHGSVWDAVGVAAVGAMGVLVIRAAFVLPLLRLLARRRRHGEQVRGMLEGMQDRIAGKSLDTVSEERVERFRTRIGRRLADIDYLSGAPLGREEGVLLVWAGMRGVVTLAAAQSLPGDTPQRSFLVLVAFMVAAGTLLVQGSTLPWVVRRLGLAGKTPGRETADIVALLDVVEDAGRATVDDAALRRPDGSRYDPGVVARVRADVVREHESQGEDAAEPAERFAQYTELRLRTISAQRSALLKARSSGVHGSRLLGHALDLLDAEQIAVEMRSGL